MIFCKLILNENEIKTDSQCESVIVSVILLRWAMSHILWSWARHRRNGVRFPKRPHDSFRVPSGVPVQRSISERDVSHPVVELGLTGLQNFALWSFASRSIRTTCSKSLALLRSSVSVLSIRPRILLEWSIIFIPYGCVREFLCNCTEEWL